MRSSGLLLGGVLTAAGIAAGLPTTTTFADGPPASGQAGAAITTTARPTSQCDRLRGKDLAPSRNVKLVRRRNDGGGTDLVSCVRPDGRVRVLASSSDHETTVEGYRIRQVTGAIVLLATSYDSQYATESALSAADIRSGREYLIARSCSRLDGGSCGSRPATVPAAFVNRRGQAAAAIVLSETSTVTIAGFSSGGERRDLDSSPAGELPASSLQLSGSNVTWMHSGERRNATLSG